MADHGAPPRCSSGGLSALSHQLMKKFSAVKERRSGNLVFSPVSIYSALSLAAAGAEGRTLRELLGVLGAKSHEGLADNLRCMLERALPDADAKKKHKSGPGGGPHVEHCNTSGV